MPRYVFYFSIFFDENFTFDGEFDTIIHSHVFEHVYYPDEFINNYIKLLKLYYNFIDFQNQYHVKNNPLLFH